MNPITGDQKFKKGEKKMTHAIRTVHFKRLETSKWEEGFLLDGGTGDIIDMTGKPIETCWNYLGADINGEITILPTETGIAIHITRMPEMVFKKPKFKHDSPDQISSDYDVRL